MCWSETFSLNTLAFVWESISNSLGALHAKAGVSRGIRSSRVANDGDEDPKIEQQSGEENNGRRTRESAVTTPLRI